MQKMATVVDFASIYEATFLHHSARSRIVNEEISPESRELLFPLTIVNHRLKSFGAIPPVPIRLANPIANLGIVLANLDVADSMEIVTHATDEFV